MPKRKQGEVDSKGVQDFELIQLLVQEAHSNKGASTSIAQRNKFESFDARFQSYIDQIPSYLHSVSKEGFFPHFFLGSFSILPDTQIAEKLGVKKVYFRFDTAKTLKVVVVKNSQIKRDADAIQGIGLFSISEDVNSRHQFTSGELEYILKENLHPDIERENKIDKVRGIKDRIKGTIKSKLVQINKSEKSISVETQNEEILHSPASHNFHEIKKEEEIWKDPEDNTKTRPEDYIAELTDPNVEEVKKSSGKVLSKISNVHSKHKGSFIYADKAREAAHHGFIAGALVNFRYRHNLRVYLEQFAGRGYADIVLVPRGKDRSLNAVPIIIELKAGTGTGTALGNALEQAKDYAKGFQPNTMRVLTVSDNVLCVGLNLDSTEKFSMYISPPADRKPARPTIQKLLEVTSSWSGEESAIADLKKEIKQPLERIYHTFPGTPEKGGNYFSRFLLGQLLLANEFKRVDLKRFIFLYDEYPLDSTTKSGKPVTTFTLIRGGRNEEVFIFHVREGGRGDRSSKKILMPDSLTEQSKITEVYISLSEQKKSDFFNIEEVNRYDSLSEYKKGKDFFKGKLKEVPYLNGLREAFDEAFKSQITPAAGKVLSVDKYDSLTKKVGEGMFSFKDFIGEEAHFQGVLHGAFSYYSDLKLKESPKALILTEFQTGRGKRIDMVVHGISTDKDGNAKEYDPVGLELKGPREGKTADALVKEANDQINTEYVKGVTYKTLTDGKEVAFMGVVFDKGASNADSLILMSKDEFASVKVVHSSIFSFSQQQCSKGRKQRSTGMACIDSFDQEKITEEEKEQRVKELFDIDNAKDFNTEIIDIGYEQVFDMIGNAYRTDIYVNVKDNNGNDKKLIIGDIIEIRNAERYFVDDYSDGIEILVKVGRSKDHVIKEKIKGQNIEYYLSIDGYEVKFDDIIKDFTTDAEREKIHNKLHQLSNDKQLLENKKYIEDIGNVQTNQDYSNIVEEIKQNLLAKGVREDTFDRFKSHFDDLGEKVFADYISNVESSLQEKGIEFDHNKFDSAKIKGAKSGKFFSLMAIYDLLDSIGDTATLGRHDNNALKQVFGINGILDAMDDVRTSVSISSNSKVGKLIGKIPGPARQAFVKVISNPVVQSITFATIAYQFGYSINEIAQGNHHPLNYYWTTSSGVKLASMSIRPISAGVSFTIKSVSATTKILRGLSAAGKVLGRASVVTMVADVLITIGVEIHERIEYTKAIAEQVPLLPGGEQAEVFFAGVIKFFTGRDVEKEYEDTIRIKGYLTYVKEAAIKLLNDNYDIAAVVQYVISIEEKYSEIIRKTGPTCVQYGGCVWGCELENKYNDISFDGINTASNVKNDLSSLEISKALPMIPYTLNMQGFECTLPVLGTIAFPLGNFIANKCLQESYEKEKVYIVNTDAKHIPHLTKYEYENLGLKIVSVPLKKQTQKPQCSEVINTRNKYGDMHFPCNIGAEHKQCQQTFTLSGEPFIFTNPRRKDPGNTKKQTFPRGSILYISGPKTLTAAANYPAVMHIPEGSNIRYIGSKNNETIFIINNSMSGTLKGGAGKENTLVMNVKANNIAANLHSGTIRYGNSNNIRLVNTYNYVSNSDNKQNITTHCETRLINVKNAEVWQNSSNCTDKDYEARVVNKENVHHRGLKQTIFIVNEDSDNARIISDLGSTGKIKGNIDIIKVQVANITQWGISEDIEKVGYSLDLLANNTQSIVSSTKINDFKNLVIQVNSNGITESVAIQDKSLSDTIEDIRYQELKSSGSDISREVIQNSAKKLKAFIQASILDQELLDTYQIAKDIVNNNNFDIPVSQVEVIKNHMGVPSEKVIIASMYSGQVIVDFSYSSSDVTSSYQKYLNGGRNYGYDDYLMLCNYYQDITIEGEKGQHQYIIKLPDTLNSKISSLPIRLNLKIKNKAVPIPYSIIDFAELSVTGVDSISIEQGKRDYINECYGKSISDLTEDSLEIQDITILDSKGTKWSLSIGLVDYFKNLENQQIVLRINNELYKIDSTNLRLEHLEINPSSFRYYQPEEQGLQIYHNQPIDKNDIGLVDFRDKSILDFDTEITDDSLVLSHKNNTLAKVENWNTYQSAREMMFAFNDTMVSNLKCIVSACNSEDIIEDFNKKKVTLLKEHMFDAIVRNNINEAKGLIRKIESINTERKNELTPLYMAIQEGRLDVVKVLFDRKDFSVENKDTYPLHLAAQEGKLNIAKFLVDKGADIGAKGNDGRTPLHVAACSGDLDMVKFFLDKNASIEAKSNDPYKMMGIVESAKKEIINQADTAPNIKRWAEFFTEKLRHSIKSVAQEKLKDGMLHDRYGSVNRLANEIYKSDGKLFDDIIKTVINDVYGRIDTKKILSSVRNHGYIAQLISSYVAVFDAMQENDDLNTGAVFKLAYYVKETMNFDNYANARSEKRSDLEELKSRLPESVRNAVFASEVCIKNIDHNEYLYAASNYFSYDDDRRRVFTWIPKDEKNDKFRWEIKLDGDDYSIMNVEFNEYLYGAVDYFNYDNERRKVFTWIPGGRVGRDTWKIEPIGSSCYIMNVELNEYLYAAVDHFNYDDERRRVFTWIPKNSKSDQFKWNIEDCGHAVKRRDISSSHTDLNSDTTRSSRKAELDKELLSATKIGNLSEVKNLVNQGASVDAEDKDGNTPFHNAALKGYLTIAQYLVEKGVDVNASNEDGWTPMHGSALKGHLEVVRFLIEKGANISAENIFGEKPIHCAAKRNNKDIIEVLLKKGASINDADKNGRTPLYFASWNGYLGLVEYFVRDKKANINIKDKYGKTPLDVAIDRNHISVIGYLSKKQLELCKELLVVVQSGDLSKVQDLVNQGASLDIQSEDGLTLLHFAFINNRLDIAGYLIQEGVDINVRDNDGATCLHYVSRFGRLNAVKYLISKGADIDAEDSNDRTPLDVADSSIIKILRQAHLDKELLITVQSSDLERIKSLIAQGVSKDEHGAYYFAWIGNLGTVKFIVENEGGVNVTDKYGCTLLHWAARGGHLEIVKFLLEKGANINARSILGRMPIHVAAINNRKNIVEFFISKGADINDADKDGWTPLHWAASRGNLEVTKFLVEKGANINAENVFGRKPIHRAAEDNHKNIIDFLLSKGVSVDDADKQGHTPLYWASWGGHLDMVKYLIGKGADINAQDKGGKTPLDIAKDKGHNNIVEYLEKKFREERGERKRRHHYGDHNHHHMSRKPLAIDSSNQPEIATSSGIRPSSWINDCISWVKSSVGRLLSSKSEGTASSVSQVDGQFAKASISNSSFTGTTLPSDGKDKRQENGGFFRDNVDYVNANLKRMCEGQAPVKFKPKDRNTILEMGDHYLSQIDFNGTITLFDLLIRRVTGQKYISTVDQSISPLEAQEYTLNITKGFEKVVEQAGLKSGVSMHRLNIDYMRMQKEITKKVMSGKFDEISGILKSYVEKACPDEEAGKLSPKKFDKFMLEFNSRLNVVLNQSIEQILHNRDGRLEVDDTKQMSLEPQSYLSNASVHSHSEVSTCLSEIGVTKLGGNLNR